MCDVLSTLKIKNNYIYIILVNIFMNGTWYSCQKFNTFLFYKKHSLEAEKIHTHLQVTVRVCVYLEDTALLSCNTAEWLALSLMLYTLIGQATAGHSTTFNDFHYSLLFSRLMTY